MIYKWPSSLLKHLETVSRNFILNDRIDERKLVTAPWHICLNLKSFDALGLKNVSNVNYLMLAKLTCRMLQGHEICFYTLRSKFFRHGVARD